MSALSFWQLLKENTIEIPVIQRDYAQGRPGRERLRARFLAALKRALDEKEPLILDFIYGSVVDGKFIPIDGQQRLTTLWLLHWYIAHKAGELANARDILKKFTYTTRRSAREFCEKLCDFDGGTGSDIAGHIRQKIWFHAAWENDPTIRGMLAMLRGGSEGTDTLEALFSSKEDFGVYWGLLISDKCPIRFYHLSMRDFDLSDDLYIKMNARGLFLTNFENLKSELVKYIREKTAEKDPPDPAWQGLNEGGESIAFLMDARWTDMFWKSKKDGRIDEIFFAFLNRFFLNYHLGEIKEEDAYYKYFVPSDEQSITYTSLQDYKFKGAIDRGLLEDLRTVLNAYGELESKPWFDVSLLNPPWDDEEAFSFIPVYKKKGSAEVEKITWRGRLVFYALCRYLAKGTPIQDSFERWMRFVWNLASTYNPDGSTATIRDLDSVKKAIEIIDGLDPHDVYKSLIKIKADFNSNRDPDRDSALRRKMLEECEKAEKIESANGSWYWENEIREAERYALFKGTIPFLCRDGEGKPDWDNFDKRCQKIALFWTADGKLDDINAALLLSNLIKRFDINNFDTIRRKLVFNNQDSAWRYLLNNGEIRRQVNDLLLGRPPQVSAGTRKMEPWEKRIKVCLEMLSSPKLLIYIIKNIGKAWIAWTVYDKDAGGFSLYRYRAPWQARIVLDARIYTFFDEFPDFKIDSDYIVPGTTFFILKDDRLKFTYNGQKFLWNTANKVFLLNPVSGLIDSKYSCQLAGIDGNVDAPQVKDALNKLIRSYLPARF